MTLVSLGDMNGGSRDFEARFRSGHELLHMVTHFPDPIRLEAQFSNTDACAFTIQPSGFLGNSGRDMLLAPNLQELDFSLANDITIGFIREAASVAFRADAFNILNAVSFASAGTSGFASNGTAQGDMNSAVSGAGETLNTVGHSRPIQLASKIFFQIQVI